MPILTSAETAPTELSDGQVRIRDLVMGRGTPFRLLDFNPFARNTRVEQSGARAWNHGSWSGVEWGAETVVPLRIKAEERGAWVWLHQQIAAAFRPVGESSGDVEMRFVIDGREYAMSGRPRMVEPEVQQIGTGILFTQAAFVSLDGFIYDGAEQTFGPLGLPTTSGGLTVPFTAPFTIDATLADGFVDLTNNGTAEAGLRFRIDGPVSQPWVALQPAAGGVHVLRLDVDIAAGQWVDVDTEARSVLLNGTTARRSIASGEWPMPPAGTSRLRWQASEFNNTATLSGSFRPRYW